MLPRVETLGHAPAPRYAPGGQMAVQLSDTGTSVQGNVKAAGGDRHELPQEPVALMVQAPRSSGLLLFPPSFDSVVLDRYAVSTT